MIDLSKESEPSDSDEFVQDLSYVMKQQRSGIDRPSFPKRPLYIEDLDDVSSEEEPLDPPRYKYSITSLYCDEDLEELHKHSYQSPEI